MLCCTGGSIFQNHWSSDRRVLRTPSIFADMKDRLPSSLRPTLRLRLRQRLTLRLRLRRRLRVSHWLRLILKLVRSTWCEALSFDIAPGTPFGQLWVFSRLTFVSLQKVIF